MSPSNPDAGTVATVGGRTSRRARWGATLVLLMATAPACRQDMHDQPRQEPLEASAFFADGRASRPPVAGTVARGHLNEDEHLYLGKVGGEFVETFPLPITMEVMTRGRERYDIFCAPCHDRLGTGQGMVVKRGFTGPVSFHDQRLKESRAGYIYDVIAHGFGRMSGYAAQIPVEDRWAIVAYVRALQASRGPLETLPPEVRRRLARQPARTGAEPVSGHAEEQPEKPPDGEKR